MSLQGNVRLGFKRLAFVLVVALVGALMLYFVVDNLIVSRRHDLFTVEIIVYIVIANILSFLIIILSYRAAQWIIRGFSKAKSEPERRT